MSSFVAAPRQHCLGSADVRRKAEQRQLRRPRCYCSVTASSADGIGLGHRLPKPQDSTAGIGYCISYAGRPVGCGMDLIATASEKWLMT